MIASLIVNREIETFSIFDSHFCSVGIADGYTLGCQSLLRYIGNDGMFITNEDHGQWFGLAAPKDVEKEIGSRIKGRAILSVEIHSQTGDLTIQLDGGRMEIIASSCGYENFTLDGPSGFICAGYGGTQLES
jgi:hypothetical protein